MVQNIIIYYGLPSLSPKKGKNPKNGSKTLKKRKGKKTTDKYHG